MADQVFDLTQTGQQVQDIINDANNVKGAGSQTTLTTESVLLKDINGNYHKILKSSFTEAIRDTLAGLLVNNDKGTTINQIAAIANGDFGSITPANLASVLGALKFYTTCSHTTGPGYGNAKWTKIATADWDNYEGIRQHMTLLVVGGGGYSSYSCISLLSIAKHHANILALYKGLIGSNLQFGYTLTENHIDIYLHPINDYNDKVQVCLLTRNNANNCDVVKEENALSAEPSGWVSISGD